MSAEFRPRRSGESLVKEAFNMKGYAESEIASVARNLATVLRDALAVVRDYEDWFEDSPEDSWRFQRDLMKALNVEPEPDDIWEQGDDGEFVVNDIPPEEFMPVDMDEEKEMRP